MTTTIISPLHQEKRKKQEEREERSRFATALIITQREVQDSLRDWRILAPIIILTLLFPFLMNITADLAVNWVAQYNADIIGERIIPFLLLIVGFFPMSFSLVIALETFVGEKERNSIEPLLSMPVTDLELYLGKMLAALVLPLIGSYLGIGIYLIGLYISIGWLPDWALFTQMVLLTTMKGLVMVSGAVVISSQTTSVRASNLLASFIIIPMALLLQGESILLFWGNYDVIWFIILALLVVDLILIRMGMKIFNREEILSSEFDSLSLVGIWRDFKGYFLRPPDQVTHYNFQTSFKINQMIRQDIPRLLQTHQGPLALVAALLIVTTIVGGAFASAHPLPAELLDLSTISEGAFKNVNSLGVLPQFSVMGIFGNNMRVMALTGISSLFSFGALALIWLMLPLGIVGYFAGVVNLAGYNPWVFLLTFIAPHGVLEIPAAVIGTAFALRIGLGLISPPYGLNLGQGLLLNTANFIKVLIFVVIPLLFLAAILEVYVTPWLVIQVYTG